MKMLISFASSINLILIRGTGAHQKGHQRDEYNSSTNQFGLDIDGPKAGFFSMKDEHSKRALFRDDSQDHIIQKNSSPTKENKNVQELDDELASNKILKPTISLKDDLPNTEALISEDENLENVETSKQISASGKIQYNDGKLKQDHPNLKKSDTNETVKQITESGKLQDGRPKHKTQAVEILDGDKKSNISPVEVPDYTQTSINPHHFFSWLFNYWSPSTNHSSESANNLTKSINPYENHVRVGVHSANLNFDRGEKYRSGNFYKFMKEHNIPPNFLMGHPEFQGSGHQQGVSITQEQPEMVEKVKNEQEEHVNEQLPIRIRTSTLVPAGQKTLMQSLVKEQEELKQKYPATRQEIAQHSERPFVKLQVGEAKEVPPPRIFLLFMVEDSLPLKDYWDYFLLDAGDRYAAFVHCYAKSGCLEDGLPAFLNGKTVPFTKSSWCGIGIVEVMNQLLKTAQKTSVHSNDNFIFISESTLPAKSFGQIYSELTEKQLSRFLLSHQDEWRHLTLTEDDVQDAISSMIDIYEPEAKKFVPLKDIATKTSLKITTIKHHQWISLTRAHAETAVRKWEHRKLTNSKGYFGVGCPDESWYFMAVFGVIPQSYSGEIELPSAASDMDTSLYSQGQHFTLAIWHPEQYLVKNILADYPNSEIDWQQRPAKITKISENSLQNIKNSHFFFIRKVYPSLTTESGDIRLLYRRVILEQNEN